MPGLRQPGMLSRMGFTAQAKDLEDFHDTLIKINRESEDLEDHWKKSTDALRDMGLQSQITFAIMAGGIGKAVGLFNPAVMTRFQWAMRDLGATVGQLLVPAMERATKIVRQLADWIYNLDEGTRSLVMKVGVLAGGFVAFNAVAPMAIRLGTSLWRIFGLLRTAMTALSLGTGGWVGLILVAVGALAAFTMRSESLQRAFGELWRALEPLTETLGELLRLLAGALEPLGGVFANLIAVLGRQLQAMVPPLRALLTALKPVLMVFGEMARVLELITKQLDRLHEGLGDDFLKGASGLLGLGDKLGGGLGGLLGFTDGDSAEEKAKKSTVGMAVQRASFTSIADVGRQATIKALQAGGKSPEEKTAESVGRIEGKLDGWLRDLGLSGRKKRADDLSDVTRATLRDAR